MTRILTVEEVQAIRVLVESGIARTEDVSALIASHEALRERVRELEERQVNYREASKIVRLSRGLIDEGIYYRLEPLLWVHQEEKCSKS